MKKHTEIDIEQSDLVFKFLEVLFGDSVEEYWDLISKVDQARVYGMYKVLLSVGEIEEGYSFSEYTRNQFMIPHREQYEDVKENPGVATHLRYTDEGEHCIYVLENTVATRVYIVPTEEKVFPVTLTADTILKNDEISLEWKIRMYIDQDYKYV